MTVREKVTSESPDGKVLYIEELRQCLGVGPVEETSVIPEGPSGTKTPPSSSQGSVSLSSGSSPPSSAGGRESPLEVLLIGHDMHGNFKNMRKDGIEVGNHLHYTGCLDTHVVIEDTRGGLPKGLSGLMERYDFAECHWSSKKGKTAWVFVGAHNAGNDAVATLKVAIAQALDLSIKTYGGGVHEMTEGWFGKPLPGIKSNLILLAYDTENATNTNYNPTAQNRTTEHGFAWLWLTDVIDLAPGINGVNWYPYIRAKHFINGKFKNYKNADWVVGNPMGFWPQYGKSEIYREEDGSVPFDALFQRLAAGIRDQPANTVIDSLATLKLAPAAFHALPSNTRLAEDENASSIRSRDSEKTQGPVRGRGRGSGRGSALGRGHASMRGNRTPKSAAVAPRTAHIPVAVKTRTVATTAGARSETPKTDGRPNPSITITPRPAMSWADIAKGKK